MGTSEETRRKEDMEKTPIHGFENLWNKLNVFVLGKDKQKKHRETFTAWLALAGLPLGQSCKVQNVAASKITKALIIDKKQKIND